MTLQKGKAWDYFILTSRALIAFVFLSYGIGKLTDSQFGLRPEELVRPVKDLSLFRLSWFLFDKEPFKSFIGVCQIITALLLLYNRTLIIGALMSLPILANILVIDITYIQWPAFYWRLSTYIFLDLLILWHYRDRMTIVWHTITKGIGTKFKYPFWAYLFLPVMALCLEFFGVIPKIIFGFVINPRQELDGLIRTFHYAIEVLKKL